MITEIAPLGNKVQMQQQVLIERLNLELENRKKELESFSYSVSHDLRSPLRGIQGFAAMFVDKYYDEIDNEGKRLLKKISINVEKMERQMDEMVRLYRIGTMDVCLTSFDMNDLVSSVLKNAHNIYQGTKIRVGPLGKAYADVNLMRQVLINLISNAVKFSEGNKKPEIEIGCLVFEEESHFYVKDNGVGFDDSYTDKLFGIFQRLHDPALYSGLGVGLAIVKQIVGRHDGRVWAIGKENEGATFYFSLPHQKDNRTM